MNQANPYLIKLCNQLETQLGFKIKNIANAQKCSTILALEKLHISPHTLARLYGVVKPYRNPYKNTLNLISRYLNYTDWEDYCKNQTSVPFDPNYFLTESSDGFSLAVLQLALVNEDFNALKLVFEKAKKNYTEAINYTAAELIGDYVRKSKKQKELLQLLSDSVIGRLLFYESYVDEDNEHNYFSDALIHQYLPKTANNYRKLFVYCFLISQSAHKEQKLSIYSKYFLNLTNQLDKSNCHFHELSRWLECLILIDGLNNILHETWMHHVKKIIEFSIGLSLKEKAWLFSRSLKAFILLGLKDELFNCNEWNENIDNLIKNQNKDLHSIALYVIQLYWITKSIHLNSKIIYTPFRIHSFVYQNESNDKKAIEFAVASMFATGENKIIINSNLKSFCETNKINWILRLIDNS
jgi:hypothetical protein